MTPGSSLEDKAKSAFVHAARYDEIARMLQEKFETNPEFTMPRMVNKMLCIELYLKSLLMLEKIDFKWKHEPDYLFGLLSMDSKLTIEMIYNAITPPTETIRVDVNTEITIEKNLLKNLEDMRDAFIVCRYPYEPGKTGRPKMAVNNTKQITTGIRSRILMLKPDWQTLK